MLPRQVVAGYMQLASHNINGISLDPDKDKDC